MLGNSQRLQTKASGTPGNAAETDVSCVTEVSGTFKRLAKAQ